MSIFRRFPLQDRSWKHWNSPCSIRGSPTALHGTLCTCHRCRILPLYVSWSRRSPVNPTGLLEASVSENGSQKGLDSPEATTRIATTCLLSQTSYDATSCTPKGKSLTWSPAWPPSAISLLRLLPRRCNLPSPPRASTRGPAKGARARDPVTADVGLVRYTQSEQMIILCFACVMEKPWRRVVRQLRLL